MADASLADENITGSITMSGWTKASYTQLGISLAPGYDIANVLATGSAQTIASLTHADFPAGGTLRLLWQIAYKKA